MPDSIYTALIATIVQLIGSQLSTIPTATGTRASVVRAYQDGAKPDYPFVILEKGYTGDLNSWILEETIDGAGNYAYVVGREVVVDVRCCSDKEDAWNIMEDLRGLLSIPINRGIFHAAEPTAKIKNLGNVIPVYQSLPTQTAEDHILPITIEFYTTYTNTDVGYYDKGTINGQFSHAK